MTRVETLHMMTKRSEEAFCRRLESNVTHASSIHTSDEQVWNRVFLHRARRAGSCERMPGAQRRLMRKDAGRIAQAHTKGCRALVAGSCERMPGAHGRLMRKDAGRTWQASETCVARPRGRSPARITLAT